MKKVAIIQSSYIPWKGYFDIINSADEFILLDNVQYTRRDWRNRNAVKDGDRLRWLTIPVTSRGRFHQRIDEVRVADHSWSRRHFNIVSGCYLHSPFFVNYEPLFAEAWSVAATEKHLAKINRIFIELICSILNIGTRITDAPVYSPEGRGSDLILDLCRKSGAQTYITGPAARSYLIENDFRNAGIGVQWFSYEGYPEYPQQGSSFVHNVSIIDLIFNTGPGAFRHMLSF